MYFRLFSGYGHDISPMHFTAYLPRLEHEQQQQQQQQSTQYISLNVPSGDGQGNNQQAPTAQKKSLSMCFTSTGAAHSLPPKKKDIYRPYSLDDRPFPPRNYEMRIPAEEDLHAAHAILDLSASTAFLPPPAPHQLMQQPLASPPIQQRSFSIILSDSEDNPQALPNSSEHKENSSIYDDDTNSQSSTEGKSLFFY